MADSRFKKASDLLEKVVGPEAVNSAAKYSDAFANWKKIAGERFAAHSKVVDIRNGTIIVEADHPGWIQLMQAKQGAMLDALQRSFPTLGIGSLMFRLARDRGVPGTRPLAGSMSDKAKEPEYAPETDEAVSEAESVGADGTRVPESAPSSTMVENPEMKALFDRFSDEVRSEAKKKR